MTFISIRSKYYHYALAFHEGNSLRNFTFMLPCIVIDFFLNNQPDALIIQIYAIIKFYIFRASYCPSSGVFHCIFGTGKFHADFDDRFHAESGCSILTLLGSGHQNLYIKNGPFLRYRVDNRICILKRAIFKIQS